MADRGTAGFSPEQTAELAALMTGMVNVVNEVVDTIKKQIANASGDEILGESESKVAINENLAQLQAILDNVTEKGQETVKRINQIADMLGVSVAQNIKSTEDATAALNSLAKKAQDATGANA